MTKHQKKRKADRVYESDKADDNMPQRTTKDIADKHAEKQINIPQQREAMKTLGESEQGKELFDFVLKGMVKPDKK